MVFARLAVCIILDCHQPVTFQNPVLVNNNLDNSTLSVPFFLVFWLRASVYIKIMLNPLFYMKYLLLFQCSLTIYFIQRAQLTSPLRHASFPCFLLQNFLYPGPLFCLGTLQFHIIILQALKRDTLQL